MYEESPEQVRNRLNAFTYRAPGPGQAKRYTNLRVFANNLAFEFNHACPPSRELSLAMTHLEQALMWANAAIARHE
jgi:hypothetical protein